MEDFANPEIHEITCMCSAQSAKTVMMMALLAWVLEEDPGPILWVTATQKEANKFARARLMPLIELCEPLLGKLPKGRYDKTNTSIYFPGAPFYVVGADSPLSLQSHPIRYLFLDEVRSWKPGALEMVAKRTRSFRHTYKKMIVSTAGNAHDELHQAFLKGSQSTWEFHCPNCHEPSDFGWGDVKSPGGLKWESHKIHGQYDWDRLLRTVRYVCPHCQASWHDTEYNRKLIAQSGRWKDNSESHKSSIRSYQWNSLLPWWPSWHEAVQEFLETKAALAWGGWQRFRTHICETRGEPWTDDRRHEDSETILSDRVGKYTVEDYETFAAALYSKRVADDRQPIIYPDRWEEARRIMTVDVQGQPARHFWFVVRSWNRNGGSRLLDEGRLWGWDEIESKRQQWSVHPNYVCIDSGHFTSEVYDQVLRHRCQWKAFKGDDKDGFIVQDRQGNRVKTIWQASSADPGIGTVNSGRMPRISLFLFSKPSTIDRLDLFLKGAVAGWEIHPGASEEYRTQVTAYYRQERLNAQGVPVFEWRSKRNNHLADCERMQIAAAAINNLLHFEFLDSKTQNTTEKDGLEGEIAEAFDGAFN